LDLFTDKDDQETPEIEQSLVSSGDNQSDGTRWKVAAILNNQQLREELMDYIELQVYFIRCLIVIQFISLNFAYG